MKYSIYRIKIGKAKYIGSTNNYQRRMAKHRKDLSENKHVNDLLQSEFNKGNKFNSEILTKVCRLEID